MRRIRCFASATRCAACACISPEVHLILASRERSYRNPAKHKHSQAPWLLQQRFYAPHTVRSLKYLHCRRSPPTPSEYVVARTASARPNLMQTLGHSPVCAICRRKYTVKCKYYDTHSESSGLASTRQRDELPSAKKVPSAPKVYGKRPGTNNTDVHATANAASAHATKRIPYERYRR